MSTIISRLANLLILVVSCFSNVSATIVAQYDFTGASPFSELYFSGASIQNHEGVGILTNILGGSDGAHTWNGVNPSASQSWILSVDAQASPGLASFLNTAGNNTEVGVGILAANSSDPLVYFAFLNFSVNYDSGIIDTGYSSRVSPVGSASNFNPISQNLDTLTLAYDADTKLLKSLASDGTTLEAVNVQTEWGMSDTDTFLLGITGNVRLNQAVLSTDQSHISLDNLRLETVPEPSSVMLLGIACIIKFLHRKR